VGTGRSIPIGHSRDFGPLRVIQFAVLAELPHVSVARIDNLIDKSARARDRVGAPSYPGGHCGASGSAHLCVIAALVRETALFLL
jgi:hypothetical protein